MCPVLKRALNASPPWWRRFFSGPSVTERAPSAQRAMRGGVRVGIIAAALLMVQAGSMPTGHARGQGVQNLQIHAAAPFYWEINGEPTLLLGGSKDDNLFQVDDVAAHLERLASVGGNYVRCTMSSRDEGNEKPYLKGADGRYDLSQPSAAYWKKLEQLLTVSRRLGIVVQIEVWATYDFYEGEHGWAQNPFNPALNASYAAAASGLPKQISYPAQSKVNPFFLSVPALEDNEMVLAHQQRFVDRLLSVSLEFGNVLYAIDNETNAPYAWGAYWAEYLHAAARQAGRRIYVTEMWDYWDPSGGAVEGALAQHPDLGGWFAEHTNPKLHERANFSYSLSDTASYQFLDVSNHNAQTGEAHYQTGLWVRNAVERSGNIRPINNVKIYGGDLDRVWAGTRRDGQERFWRNIFAGHAAARFHRPSTGIGLNEEAQNAIKAARLLTGRVNFFGLRPRNAALGDRAANEAFSLEGDREYLLYFPAAGDVTLQAGAGDYEARWLHLPTATWGPADVLSLPGRIQTPSGDAWGLVLKRP